MYSSEGVLMPLEERQRLLRAYRAAVQAYHDASAGFDEAAFQDSLERTEQARNQAETARAALLKHERGEAPDPVSTAGSAVALFNVSTERWVLFEITECGPPPEGAMAYTALPQHQRGDWIVSPEEMQERERRQANLYYTEAGLAVLRKAGLEM